MTSNRNQESGEPAEDRTFALHALFAYGAVMLLCIFPGGLLQFYNPKLGLIITEIAFIALPAVVVLFMHRTALSGTLFAAPRPVQTVLTVFIGVCATVIAVGQGIAARKTLAGIDTSGGDIAGSIPLLSLVILAPLCEELLFRTVIQNGLARHWGNRASVLLTALLFALFHLQLLRFAETFSLGIFTGIVFLKTRNVWYSVVVHAMCNSLGPVLWRLAPNLDFLLNRGTGAALACLALVGCYYLGGKAPATTRGIWQHLSWAAFGSPESFRTSSRSRAVAPVMWGIVLPLTVLLGYGHVMMLRHMEETETRHGYIVSEKDYWTVVSADEVQVRSDLSIRKFPDKYAHLVLQLPFADASIGEITLLNTALPYSRTGPAQYAVDLSQYKNTAGSGTITVLWSFSVDSLKPDAKWGYRAPLKSLAPSDSLSLSVTISDGSGFRPIGDTGDRTRHPFNGSTERPKTDYGSCGIGMERETGQTGNGQYP